MFNFKRISDPVHGSIGLSDLEVKIIGSRAFQRLRNVKQLGLVDFVFPSAGYSRFSHSLGVCHVTGQILESLNTNSSASPVPSGIDIQRYRLAGLLHDIGHYPFSHAMEEALINYYSSKLVEPVSKDSSDVVPSSRLGNEGKNGGQTHQASATLDGDQLADLKEDRVFRHERVGKEVLLRDPDLQAILSEAGIDPATISSIFLREETSKFANLVSSDLDADRIDYLLRTAHHTGLPYGSVDLAYLLSQLRVDGNGWICLDPKALRTVDHFLLSRYFDYHQVVYHKTVAAAEMVLKQVLSTLLETELIDGSASWVSSAIASGEWHGFDELSVMEKIRGIYLTTDDPIVRLRAKTILERVPPKMVAETDFIAERTQETDQWFRIQRSLISRFLPEWSEKFKIDERLWYVWEQPPLVLTKIGSYVPITSREEAPEDKDRYDQAVRILGPGESQSLPLVRNTSSLMSVLSNYAHYTLRIYVLFPDSASESLREDIEKQITADLPEIRWT